MHAPRRRRRSSFPAHTMKSEARQFGAEPLGELAEEIELAGPARDRDAASSRTISCRRSRGCGRSTSHDRPARGRDQPARRPPPERGARARATRISAGSERRLFPFALSGGRGLGSAPEDDDAQAVDPASPSLLPAPAAAAAAQEARAEWDMSVSAAARDGRAGARRDVHGPASPWRAGTGRRQSRRRPARRAAPTAIFSASAAAQRRRAS